MRPGNRWIRIAAAVLAILLLSCCGKPSPDWIDKEEVLRDTRIIVEQLSDGDNEALTSLFSPFMEERSDEAGLTDDIEKKLNELGEYDSVLEGTITLRNGSDSGYFVVAVLNCQYQNGTAAYAVTYDETGRICDFCMDTVLGEDL